MKQGFGKLALLSLGYLFPSNYCGKGGVFPPNTVQGVFWGVHFGVYICEHHVRACAHQKTCTHQKTCGTENRMVTPKMVVTQNRVVARDRVRAWCRVMTTCGDEKWGGPKSGVVRAIARIDGGDEKW